MGKWSRPVSDRWAQLLVPQNSSQMHHPHCDRRRLFGRNITSEIATFSVYSKFRCPRLIFHYYSYFMYLLYIFIFAVYIIRYSAWKETNSLMLTYKTNLTYCWGLWHTQERLYICPIIFDKHNRKMSLDRPRRRWKDNIRLAVKETASEDVTWIHLAQLVVQRLAFMKAVMNFRTI